MVKKNNSGKTFKYVQREINSVDYLKFISSQSSYGLNIFSSKKKKKKRKKSQFFF